ncbi:hypothetical protein [Chitinophaga solisilvae]|uniref:hypothetical protein n=1 Tax=Chitinophaga solisilvae TaxID=1233460 RepID=UPI00136AA6B2|nr:hypothetical protein [Chitinophaga solisilvae]
MKILVRCLGLLILAFLVLFILWLNTDKKNEYKNGFSRKFLSGIVTDSRSYTIDPQTYTDLCGANESKIYFKPRMIGSIIATDWHFENKTTINLGLSEELKKQIGYAYTAEVDSPFIYLYPYNIPAVIIYHLSSGKTSVIRKPGTFYTRSVAVTDSSFIFRQFITGEKDQNFSSWKISNNQLTKEVSFFPILKDEGISTDGFLLYSKPENLLLYSSFYKNSFYLFDTSLQLVNTFKTIDTITAPNIKTGEINGVLSTNVVPKKMVNRNSIIYGNVVLNDSRLMADNEKKSDFLNNSVIDIYHLKKGQYIGSFYLPVKDRDLPVKLAAIGNKIVSIGHRSLVIADIKI